MLRHRRDVVLSVGAAVLGSVCQTAVPLVARQIVDGVILTRTSALWPWLLLLVGLAAASFGFAYVRRYRGGRVALEVQYDLRNDMHDHLQSLDFDNLGRMPTGQLVARANSDSTLVQGLLSFFPIMSSNILLLLLSLGVMLYLSPLLALVSVVVAPSLLIVSYRMRWRVFPATWDGQQREGEVVQIVDEDLNGVRVVKAFGQEQREVERVAEAAKAVYGSQMRAVRLQSRYQPLLEAIPLFAQVAVLALGGWLALHHNITLGTFLAFSTYVTQLMAPARQLAGVLTIGQQARAGLERIFQLLDLPAAISDAPDAIELPDLRGDIRFSNVHFSYGDSDPVLRGVDLHIAPGERVAIVGPSGSGKSSLAMLVPRFYDPTEGAVLIDGHDVRTVKLRSLRRQVGVVFEDSFLFSELGPRQHRLWTARRDRRADRGGGPCRPGARFHPGAATGVRHRYRGAWAEPLRRAAPEDRARAGDPLRPAHPHPRRRHQCDRRTHRGGGARRAAGGHGGSHHAADRAPAVDAAPGRSDRGSRWRRRARIRHPRRAHRAQRAVPDAGIRARGGRRRCDR